MQLLQTHRPPGSLPGEMKDLNPSNYLLLNQRACNGVTFRLVLFVPWLPELFRVLVCWNIDRDVNARVIQYLHTSNITFGDECRFRVHPAFSTTSEDSWIEWPRHFTGFVFDTSKPWVQTTLTTQLTVNQDGAATALGTHFWFWNRWWHWPRSQVGPMAGSFWELPTRHWHHKRCLPTCHPTPFSWPWNVWQISNH